MVRNMALGVGSQIKARSNTVATLKHPPVTAAASAAKEAAQIAKEANTCATMANTNANASKNAVNLIYLRNSTLKH